MSATRSVDVDPAGGGDAIKRQLDALASGQCDHVTFLNAMKEKFRSEPDENWEVLSLMDQYYRRGKIPLDVFRAIKNGFAEYILGPQVATPAPDTVPTLIPAPTFTGVPAGPSMAAAAAAAANVQRATAREVHVGDVLRDRYRVEALLARGASGLVFEVSDANRLNLPPTAKRLALKVPRTPDPRGTQLSQLRHEFHQLQYLSHPNIVRAFDFDRDSGLSFFTMELLHGVHLTKVLETKSGRGLPRAHALAIIRDLSSAIAYAHRRGAVHGDVNPQNVFITMAGEVRLLGFGAAHKLSATAPAPDFERASAASDTHRYASCEVIEGHRPDAQDDIYSLSCVAFLLLTGRHPYAGSTSIEARAGRLRPQRPAGLRNRQWRMLRAGLRTDASKRPGDVGEWIEAMELSAASPRLPSANELIEAPGDRPRRWHVLAAAAAIAAVLAGLGYWFSTSHDSPVLPTLTEEPASVPPSGTAPLATPPLATPPLATPPLATAPPGPATPAAAPPRPAPSLATPASSPVATPAPSAPSPPAALKASAAAATAPAASTNSATAAARKSSSPARLEMASDTLDALPSDTVVHVTVRRKGNQHGATTFTWWTESGTAKPGIDFSPVLPHVEEMQDGESSRVLTVPLISTVRAQQKGFYVGIEATDGGAQIGARSLTQVTLPPTN